MYHTWMSVQSSHDVHPPLLVCPCEWVMSRVRMRWIASCHIYEWVMSQLWIRQVSNMNECVVWSRIASSSFSVCLRISRVTCTNEMSCVMSHLWIVIVPVWRHVNESWPAHELATPNVWLSARLSHEPPLFLVLFTSHVWMGWIASCHIYEWVVTHARLHHVTHMNKCAVSRTASSFGVCVDESYHMQEWVLS